MKIKNKFIKNKILILCYCIFLSAIYLLICTKSSPLYPFNDWMDSNAFFTMGKGMANGKILYRDLYEQKGPLLYFIHCLAYLISNNTFLGVYVFEVISFTLFLIYSVKFIGLFYDKKYSLIILPLISFIILNTSSFSHGDSAEEFCIPLLTFSLYKLIQYFVKVYPKEIEYKCLFINGIIAGCVLWIKFNLLGFWFGWMITIFFCMVINKHFIHALKSCLVFLLGMLIATFPWIIYFGINNSILYWIESYIMFNVNNYSSTIPFYSIIGNVIMEAFSSIILNTVVVFLCCYGIIIFVFYNRFVKSRFNRFCILICLLFLIMGIYGGGRTYVYYFLIISPFALLGIVAIMDFIIIILNKYKIVLTSKIVFSIVISYILITFLFTVQFNQNAYMLKIKEEDLVQYKFSSIINQKESVTLLNYGSLDIGLYTVTGIIPNIRFFQKLNVEYSRFPLNMDEQNEYIKKKIVDYIVVIELASENYINYNIPFLYNYYVLIKKDTQMFENVDINYFLFKKIE